MNYNKAVMEIFSQEVFLILFPFLLLIVLAIGAISLGLRQIPLTDDIRERLDKLGKKIREFLLIKPPKIRIGDEEKKSKSKNRSW